MYVKRPRWNTTPRPSWTTRWTWACAARALATRPACLKRPFSVATGCWSLANWSMCLPTQPLRHPPRCLRAAGDAGGYEAGAEMVEVRTGDWNTLGRDAARLRTAVFVREQGIPADVEADALDASAPRGALQPLGQPVATGGCCSRRQAWAAWAHGGGPVGARCPVGPCAAGCVGGGRARRATRRCNCTRSAAHKGSMSGRVHGGGCAL